MMYRLLKMGVDREQVFRMTWPEAVKWMSLMGYESYLERKSLEDQKKQRG